MDEWWTYRPRDFLLFSDRVYWRLFELQNEGLWPLPLLALGLGVLVLAASIRRRDWSDRAAWALVGAGWAWVAYDFLWLRYQPINWLAVYPAWAFAAEGLLLTALGLARRLPLAAKGVRRWIGSGLLAYAVVLHPLLPVATGRSLSGAEIVGLAPDPTAVATLGLLLASRGWPAALMSVVPMLWCLASWVTLHTMGAAQHPVLIGALLLFVIGLFLGQRR